MSTKSPPDKALVLSEILEGLMNGPVEVIVSSLERSIREQRRALAAVELIATCDQVRAGLITVDELFAKAYDLIFKAPKAQEGDTDLITGLRLHFEEEVEVDDGPPGPDPDMPRNTRTKASL